jgi:serralysin
MSTNTDDRRRNLRGKMFSAVALATGGAAIMAGGAQAQSGEGGVPDGYSAAAELPNVSEIERLADGSVRITLTDGRTLVFEAADVAIVDGYVYLADPAIAAADFAVAGAAAGAGGGGAALGLLGGAALLGAAAGGGGGGGGSSPPPPTTPPPDPNEAPSFTSGSSASVPENTSGAVYTATADDPDGDSLTFSIVGGADSGLFSINSSTGELTFNTPPDFENPGDEDGDNVYEVTIRASDGSASVDQTVSITVTDEDEAPEFTSASSASVDEGTTGTVYTAVADDPEGETVTYALSGTDAAHFDIDSSTGAVSFVTPPDFENPDDADSDNVYEIVVEASDGSNTSSRAISITVNDVASAGTPSFVSGSTSSVSEGQTSAYVALAEDPNDDTLSYSIGGADAGLFSIDSETGEISFNATPDFEAPGDADADNVYTITVTASNGANTASQTVNVSVTNVSDEAGDVPDNDTTEIHMVSGGAYVGELETPGDEDWIRVELTAGQRYQFDLYGSGSEEVEDPYIRLYDASGNLIAENDDISLGSIRDSRLGYTAETSGVYYIEVDSWEDGSDDERTGEYTLEVSHTDPLRNWSYQEIADYLQTGFGGLQWDVSSGDTMTVNITGLTSAGQTLARAALEMWSDVTGLIFSEVSGSADITFDDEEEGAFAGPDSTAGGFITAASVNVGTEWLDTYGTSLDTYSFQTYIHEIGHALGLGHAGPYDGSATYGIENIYLNDSWQATVMSYFSQNENTEVDASLAFVVGLQVADIIAAHEMYGASTTTRAGDTTYGFNSNAGNTIFNANNGFSNATTFTIFDAGGTDTLDYSGSGSDQTLDLREQAYSSVLGLTGNVGIAAGTVIENGIGGSGDDNLIGNDADNRLTGNGGNDRFFASGGDDVFVGGTGSDTAVFSGSAGDYTVTTNGSGNTVVTDNRAGSPDGVVELIGVETIEYDGLDNYPDFFGDAGPDTSGEAVDIASLPMAGSDAPVMRPLGSGALQDLVSNDAVYIELPFDLSPAIWPAGGRPVMEWLGDDDHTDLTDGHGKHDDHRHVYPHLDPADRAAFGLADVGDGIGDVVLEDVIASGGRDTWQHLTHDADGSAHGPAAAAVPHAPASASHLPPVEMAIIADEGDMPPSVEEGWL